jgi:mannosyltransferase OCH1-like enzyme
MKYKRKTKRTRLRSYKRKKHHIGGNSDLVKIEYFTERKNKNGPKKVSGVPLVIYTNWHTDMVTLKMAECVNNIIKMNPEFDYYMFTEDQCAKFIEENFDREVIDAYNTLKPLAYKSDLWRYCVLYKKGGVYLDIKFTSTVPLFDIIKENSGFFVKELVGNCSTTDNNVKYGTVNGVIVSKPNNLVFKYCIDEIIENCKTKLYKDNSLDVTGPCLLERNRARVFPEYDFKFTLKNIFYH